MTNGSITYELPPGYRDASGLDFKGAVPILSVQVEGSHRISMGRNYGGEGILGYMVASYKSSGGGSSSGGNKRRPVDHEGRNAGKNRKRLRG